MFLTIVKKAWLRETGISVTGGFKNRLDKYLSGRINICLFVPPSTEVGQMNSSRGVFEGDFL